LLLKKNVKNLQRKWRMCNGLFLSGLEREEDVC
jgi:hypothetical protein